jgi:hypothetical protein
MTRRSWLFLAPLLGGCAKPAAPLDAFPETVAGVWRRTSLHDIPISDAPDPVSRTAVASIRAAEYDGPGKLDARLYELSSPGVGLDLVQRWRPSADTVFFYRGRYFVVVKWQQAERQALKNFVKEVEGRLDAAARR